MYLKVLPSREYAVGSLGGVGASVVAVLVAQPIESVKVRMQTAQHLQASSTARSASRVFAELLRRPYYGVGPHLLQYALLNSVRFGSFSHAWAFFEGRRRTAAASQEGPVRLSLPEVFGCGCFSGVCVAATLHPLFVVKTHQQINRLGVAEAFSKLWQGEGARGLFRTYMAGFARFPLALGVFFATFEASKRPHELLAAVPGGGGAPRPGGAIDRHHSVDTASFAWRALAGAVAGVACWTSVYPIDVMQSRVIGEANYGAERRYSGVLRASQLVYAEEGAMAFVRGYSAVLLRAGPVNAVLLPVNDMMRSIVDGLLPPK